MSDINPQEFGRLQAQVETLIRSDAEKTELLKTLAEDMTAVRLQLAEAGGGWKLLVMLGGASATFGGAISWVVTHFSKGTP
jgi:predicted Rdx family selenoprotein